MRYLCVHCDHRFEHDGDKKPRCPECMRKHGIEKIEAEESKPLPKWVPWAGAAIVVAILGGGYAIWAGEAADEVGEEVPLSPLEPSELLGHIRRVGADVTDDQREFLVADDAIEELAEAAVSGKSGNIDKAEGVVEAIQERASAQAFVPWGMSSPRDTPIRDARRTWERMQEDGGREKLYPLEVAAVAIAALRSEGVPAMGAEIYNFDGDRTPPDPSGHLGYFGIAVWDDEPGEGEPTILDPYGGRGTRPADDDYRVLDDLQVIGAMLNHLAVHRMVRDGEPDQAFELSQSAISMDRRSPSIRSARGAILLVSGGSEEGIGEFEAAAQLRRDAPRLNNLAGIALAERDAERASRYIADALEQHEDYANGHATLAAIHLASMEADQALSELERAEELDPELPNLPMLWANYHLSQQDYDRAADRAMQAVERQPHNWQARLQAATVFRAASRYDDMRRQARAIMEMVPASQRTQVRALVEQALGPTAFEQPLDEELALDDEGEGFELPEADFSLGEGSSLLGDEQLELGGGSLMEGDGDPLLNLGDTSMLGLGGDELQLNLEE